MLARRWRAFWQRRNFSKKRSSGCFYVILSIQGFTLFFVFVVLSRISKQMLQNVRIKQIVKLFMLYSLMYVKEINKYIKKLAQTIVCEHKRLYLCNVFGRIHFFIG